ncbi:MAG: hypothetical protein EXR99_08240 [Gemmataceae bacterium]|nr:hypothetical protein [Gemmataceae bacterium]
MTNDPNNGPQEEPLLEQNTSEIPLALPVDFSQEILEQDIPLALPVTAEELLTANTLGAQATEQFPAAPEMVVPQEADPAAESPKILCKVCGSERKKGQHSCLDCGYYFSDEELAGAGNNHATGAIPDTGANKLVFDTRFETQELVEEKVFIRIYRGKDRVENREVWIYTQPAKEEKKTNPDPDTLTLATGEPEEISADFLPSFDDALLRKPDMERTRKMPPEINWPNLAWIRGVMDFSESHGLPKVLASGTENQLIFLVLEQPAGKDFWEVWDEENSTPPVRFGYLRQLAEIQKSLHRSNAFLEFVRPEHVVVTLEGKVRLKHVLEILPMPLPPGIPVKGTLFTPPELLTGRGCLTPRAGLYSFGALIYCLEILHRELSDADFDKPGVPKPFIPRFPDTHPAFGRLMSKTFRTEVEARFPTEEAGREDRSGFSELIHTLTAVGRSLDTCRLEIASWMTTGMVRTGNEDAFALTHVSESRQDDLSDAALLFLADGMGGYEAGEIAAAMTLQHLRQTLSQHKLFMRFSGKTSFINDAANPPPKGESHGPAELDIEECKAVFKNTLKEVNRLIYTASRAPGSKRRGMGCTTELVYLDGKHLVAGHVGDSRVYHLRQGHLVQVTRDQTLVNRLVELGTISAEEADHHPRKNELQQAIGGQPEVEPGIYHARLAPGDWVLICSDGLTNHIAAKDLQFMLANEAQSAQMAARRLVNLANIEGATDNATVVVVRCT